MKNIMVCTEYKGVFFAQADTNVDLTARTIVGLKNCRMALYMGCVHGVMQLAATGPTEKSRISASADIPVLHSVTAVFAVTDEAAHKWLAI